MMHVVITLKDIIAMSILGIWIVIIVVLLMYYGISEVINKIRRRWTSWRNSR